MDPRAPTFELAGGRLCLDFTNTVSDQFAEARRDKLESYAVFLAFAEQAGAITGKQARALRRAAAADPERAARALERARGLRDALFRIFYARSRDTRVPEADLAALNAALGEALAHRRVVRAGDGYQLDFERDGEDVDAPLWPIVESAADLLTSERCDRVRVCSGEETGCTWLFVDESKNQSRRWCSMSDCGNRAKARRHYHRTRVTAREP
jgi:predicted RNA-binding Zn ribbon-like protein